MEPIVIKDGQVLTLDGEYLCEEIDYISQRSGGSTEKRHHEVPSGTAEVLIKRMTEFILPESKKEIEDALWIIFYTGIHSTMSNVSSPKQRKYLKRMMHAAIFTTLNDPKIAKEMTVSDYIQLHFLAESLISRAITYEGDRLRDSTILVRDIDPAFVDAVKHAPEPQKAGFVGGLFKKR